MKLLKEEDMNRMLKGMFTTEENLRCKLCGTISINDENILKLKEEGSIDCVAGGVAKGFEKRYCYIGIAENRMAIIVLNPFDSSKSTARLNLLLEKVSSIEVKNCLLSKSSNVKITLHGNIVVNLTIISGTLACGVMGQKANLEEFFKILSEL